MIARTPAVAALALIVLPTLAFADAKVGKIIITSEAIAKLEEPRRYSWETSHGQPEPAWANVQSSETATAGVAKTSTANDRAIPVSGLGVQTTTGAQGVAGNVKNVEKTAAATGITAAKVEAVNVSRRSERDTRTLQATRRAVKTDPRVRTVGYVENDVVRVDTDLRFITAVEFAQGEIVTAVLAGDSESFEIVRLKSGNVLSIKPLVRGARTNINVYTDRRAYVLDVREGQRRGLTHRVRFEYPAPPPDAAAIAAAATAALPRNRDYSAAGDADFRPVEAWDDGTSTFFRFSRNARRPAIFWSDASGADFATNTAQLDGLTVRVGLIRERWTFRLGSEVVCIVRGPATEALRVAVAEANRARRTDSQ